MEPKKKKGGEGRGRGRGRGGGEEGRGGGRPQTAGQRDDHRGERKRGGGGDRDYDRPQTARGGGGYGSRGDRGGQDRDRDGKRGGGAPRGRGRGGHGEEGTGGGGGKRFDESSWQWKHKNGERPVLDWDMVVKVDTKLPEVPQGDKIIKRPSRDDFQKKMRELDDRAVELKGGVEAARDQRRTVQDGGKVKDGTVTYKEKIGEKIEDIKKARAKHKEGTEKLNTLKSQQRELETEKNNILKNVPRNYHTPADLRQAINEKQQRYETSSMANAEEKRLLRDIDALRRALPDMEKLGTIEPELNEIRTKRTALTKELDESRRVLDEKNEYIDKLRRESDAQRSQRREVTDAAEVFSKQIEKNNEELTSIYKTKDSTREEYYKALYESEVQQDFIRWAQHVRGQQRKLRAQQDDRKKRVEAKQAEIEGRPNPFAKEIETCQDLIKYCNRLKKEAGLVPMTSEEVAQQAQTAYNAEVGRQELEQKLKDGKIQMAQVKKDDVTVVGGGGKGKKGRRQRNQGNADDKGSKANLFQPDLHLIKMFGLVSVSPPMGTDELEDRLELLKKKEAQYQEDGESRLKKEKDELEALVEREVDEDLERERKELEEDDEYYEEDDGGYEETRKEEAGRSSLRGNQGRGGKQNNDRDWKQGNNDPRKRKAPKAEFEADDSDEGYGNSAGWDPYSKPSRGGGQQVNQGKRGGKRGGNKMDFNNEDFPAL